MTLLAIEPGRGCSPGAHISEASRRAPQDPNEPGARSAHLEAPALPGFSRNHPYESSGLQEAVERQKDRLEREIANRAKRPLEALLPQGEAGGQRGDGGPSSRWMKTCARIACWSACFIDAEGVPATTVQLLLRVLSLQVGASFQSAKDANGRGHLEAIDSKAARSLAIYGTLAAFRARGSRAHSPGAQVFSSSQRGALPVTR